MLLKIRNAGLQGQEFLPLAGILETKLAPFLLLGELRGLFHQIVTAGSRDDLDVLHGVEHRKFPNGAAPEFQSLSV